MTERSRGQRQSEASGHIRGELYLSAPSPGRRMQEPSCYALFSMSRWKVLPATLQHFAVTQSAQSNSLLMLGARLFYVLLRYSHGIYTIPMVSTRTPRMIRMHCEHCTPATCSRRARKIFPVTYKPLFLHQQHCSYKGFKITELPSGQCCLQPDTLPWGNYLCTVPHSYFFQNC